MHPETTGQAARQSMGGQAARVIPERIAKIQKAWTFQADLLRSFHGFLIVFATVASVLVAANVDATLFWVVSVRKALAAGSAIAIGLVSTFELGSKANNFRNAWRLLHAAIMRFEEEPDYTVEKLIEAYESAEKLIGDVKATPNATQ